jgi:hypothetical protein
MIKKNVLCREGHYNFQKNRLFRQCSVGVGSIGESIIEKLLLVVPVEYDCVLTSILTMKKTSNLSFIFYVLSGLLLLPAVILLVILIKVQTSGGGLTLVAILEYAGLLFVVCLYGFALAAILSVPLIFIWLGKMRQSMKNIEYFIQEIQLNTHNYGAETSKLRYKEKSPFSE